MEFRDRQHAAKMLAQGLQHYHDTHALILAIPRGGVIMGQILTHELNADLDVILVRKLRAPTNPELAIGAVDETGLSVVAEYATSMEATELYISEEKNRQLELIKKRRARYTPWRAPIDPQNRIVIIIDDGLATGATMIAALQAIRQKKPKRLICAVPVAPMDTIEKIKSLADEIVCLQTPPNFYAVGQFYLEFNQVEDDEVIQILKETANSTAK